MKEKIKARLRALYPGVNLTNARLDAIADGLSVTEETEIDAALENLNKMLSFESIARNDDRDAAAEAFKKQKEKQKEQEKPVQDPAPAPSTASDEKDWSAIIQQAVQSAVAPLAKELSEIKTGKVVETRQSKLENLFKDAPEAYKKTILSDFKRMNFENDEAFTEYFTEKETAYNEYVQERSNDGLGGIGVPFKSNGGGKKQVSEAEADAILDKVL